MKLTRQRAATAGSRCASGDAHRRGALTRARWPRAPPRQFREDDRLAQLGKPTALVDASAGGKLLPALEGVGPLDVTVADGELLQGPETQG